MPATIRLATEADADSILEIMAPVIRDTVISFELTLPSTAEFRGRIRDVLAKGPWIVADDGGRVDAYAYASQFRARVAYRWTVESSIYVRDSAQGRGLGRLLYGTLIELLRLQGFRSVIGGIALPNAASVALHETMGFRKVAHFPGVGFKLGQWVDVAFWQLDLAPPGDAPAEPRPFAEVAATPRWRDVLASATMRLPRR